MPFGGQYSNGGVNAEWWSRFPGIHGGGPGGGGGGGLQSQMNAIGGGFPDPSAWINALREDAVKARQWGANREDYLRNESRQYAEKQAARQQHEQAKMRQAAAANQAQAEWEQRRAQVGRTPQKAVDLCNTMKFLDAREGPLSRHTTLSAGTQPFRNMVAAGAINGIAFPNERIEPYKVAASIPARRAEEKKEG